MRYAIKFCYCLSKTTQGLAKLNKEAYKSRYFGEMTIFRRHSKFKIERLSVELTPKPARLESVVNERNVTTVS